MSSLRVFLRIISAWYILIVLFSTSMLVNLAQLIVSLLIFIPQKSRISACQQISNPWWELWVFVVEGWGGVPYYFHGDTIPTDECAIFIGNHGPGLDFLTGVVVSNRAANIGCGRLMTFLKASLRFLPSIGWTHYFQGSLFLHRNWLSDQLAIKAKLLQIEEGQFPRPFWIGIYPEGTRITPKKHAASIEFAKDRGLPELNYVLLPRTKGFVTLVQSLPTAIAAIYDATVAYQDGAFHLSDALFKGKWTCKAVHVYFKRIPFVSLPKDEEGLNKWLVEDFRQKDELLTYFQSHHSFSGEKPSQRTDYIHHIVVWTLWSTVFTGLLYVFSTSALVTAFSLALQTITIAVSKRTPSSSVYRDAEQTPKINGIPEANHIKAS